MNPWECIPKPHYKISAIDVGWGYRNAFYFKSRTVYIAQATEELRINLCLTPNASIPRSLQPYLLIRSTFLGNPCVIFTLQFQGNYTLRVSALWKGLLRLLKDFHITVPPSFGHVSKWCLSHLIFRWFEQLKNPSPEANALKLHWGQRMSVLGSPQYH